MKGIRDWAFAQLLSKSLASARLLSSSGSFFSEGPVNEDSNDPGIWLFFSPLAFACLCLFLKLVTNIDKRNCLCLAYSLKP